ncbi:MAG: ferrochelatase [Chlorobiaceae bacterium]|nr:ferrochelatase [Chlorobiaceae bacterium]
MTEKKRFAVILAAHGEAETTGLRENYRVNMQTLGHASMVMPIPLPLRHFISATSSMRKRIRSLSNSQASPHNGITRRQAESLQLLLESQHGGEGISFDVHAAFSASDPAVEKIIDSTRSHDGQVIVSMSPIDSTLSCGLLCSYLESTRSPAELGRARVISRLWDDGDLYPIFLDHLFGCIAQIGFTRRGKRALVLMYHGTLVADAKGGTPNFRTGLHETMSLAGRLGNMIAAHPSNPYSKVFTAFLNHDVGGTWTRPSFEEVCTEIREEGFTGADLFGCGYFADGNETIHRGDELKVASALSDVSTIPCLNGSAAFTSYLASKVSAAAKQILAMS